MRAALYYAQRGIVQPTIHPRLVLQVGYTLLPRFSLLYEPVEIESRPAVDQYINRLYVRQ